MNANTARVVFDYDGALDLARRLWALADQAAMADKSRQSNARAGAVGFRGAYAREFDSRMEQESASTAGVVKGLREDALCMARLWKNAMDEENRRRYTRHVDQLRAERNALEELWDVITGFEYPPGPCPVATPQPPHFAATAEPTRFSP